MLRFVTSALFLRGPSLSFLLNLEPSDCRIVWHLHCGEGIFASRCAFLGTISLLFLFAARNLLVIFFGRNRSKYPSSR